MTPAGLRGRLARLPRWVWVVVAIVVVLATSAIIGTTRSSAAKDRGYAGWTTPITKTSCEQWDEQMTDAQRFAMTREIVVRLKAKDPSVTFAVQFARNIDDACSSRLIGVADAAAGLATLDPEDFNP